MIEKLDFYHGAALIRVIEDERCASIRKNNHGYVINGQRLILLKYTTKTYSPWGFTLTAEDICRFNEAAKEFQICILALVCGGDGVCAIPWNVVRQLTGSVTARLSAKRMFNGCYAVSGPLGGLNKKVPLNQWPAIVFEEGDEG